MSFNQLVKSDYTIKNKEIIISVGGNDIKFVATQLSYTQKVRLAALESLETQGKGGDDTLLLWVVYSIVDQDGKRMTIEQAKALPDEYMEKFLSAAFEVNAPVAEVEKNKKKAKRQR